MDLREAAVSPPNSVRHPWEQARLEVVWQLLSPVLEKKGKAITILDIGSGDAYVINSLARRLPESRCFAVDSFYTAEDLQRLAEVNNSSNVTYFNQLDAAITGVDQVDLVTLLDVVEHVEDDHSFLQDLPGRHCLNSETAFLITVPAFQRLFSAHDVFMGHYRRYSNRSLRGLIEGTGFEVTQLGYFFISLLVPRTINVISAKLFKKEEKRIQESELNKWKARAILTNLVTQILLLDFRMTQRFRYFGVSLPGLTNYCLCQPIV